MSTFLISTFYLASFLFGFACCWPDDGSLSWLSMAFAVMGCFLFGSLLVLDIRARSDRAGWQSRLALSCDLVFLMPILMLLAGSVTGSSALRLLALFTMPAVFVVYLILLLACLGVWSHRARGHAGVRSFFVAGVLFLVGWGAVFVTQGHNIQNSLMVLSFVLSIFLFLVGVVGWAVSSSAGDVLALKRFR